MSIRKAFVSLAAIVILGMGALSASAHSTWTVTNLNDSGTGSLRSAITSANAGTGDTIVFAAGLSGTITLESSLPTIATPMTVTGPGANLVAISGANITGAFIYVTATATISGLTFENMPGTNQDGGINVYNATATLIQDVFVNNATSAGNWGGAAVQALAGAVNISRCLFSNNNAYGEGGEGSASGGAIFASGGLTVSNSTFYQNSASSGGAISAEGSTVVNSTFVSNSTLSVGGAIVFNSGVSTVSNNIFASNSQSASSGTLALFSDITGAALYSVNNVFYQNYDAGTTNEDDCIYCNTNSGAVEASATPVGLLASNGGAIQTMVPIPGAGAICAGLASQLPTGASTDARGYARLNTTYPGYTSESPCLDAGAVQSNYALSFTTEPPASLLTGAAMSPAPVVKVTESGNLLIGASVPVGVTDKYDALDPSPATVGTSAGLATFGGLTFSIAATGDALTATLALNPGLPAPLNLTTASSSFDVERTLETVPNVVGDLKGTASDVLTHAGLVLGAVTSASSTTVPIGDVKSQSPAAGTSAYAGTKVDLVLSSGSPVPNVVRLSQAAAKTSIAAAGLLVGTVTPAPSATVPIGGVISESPVAGTSVNPGSQVNLVVSTGVAVPNVVGLTQVAATAAITGAGLKLGVVTTAVSSSVPNGDVISQNPAGAQKVSGGTAVNIVVSLAYVLTIGPNNSAWGSVSPASGVLHAGGSIVPIVATPKVGYLFTGWTGSPDIAKPASAGTTIAMKGPESIVANFKPAIFVVTTTADDAAGKAANCPLNNTPASASCTLRDALAAVSALVGPTSVPAITFSPAVFKSSNTAAQNTIVLTLAGGNLTISASVTIDGPTTGSGASLGNLVTVSGGKNSEVFLVSAGTIAIANLIIADGDGGSGDGGGILNQRTLTLSNCTLTGNGADLGGAIFNAGVLTIGNSTFTGNASSGPGGAIANAGTLTVRNSTFTGNASSFGTGAIDSGGPGFTLINSTISGNWSDGGGAGGIGGVGPVTIGNSIVSGNTFPGNTGYIDISSSYTDKGGNIIGSPSVKLAAAGNYGGPAQTMLPLPGSPAICAGISANAAGLTGDQRGFGFLSKYCLAGHIDSGAVQTNYAMAFATQPPATVSVAQTLSPAPSVQLTESGVLAKATTSAVTIADRGLKLGGTTSANLSAGLATFTKLQVSAVETGDTLTASLALGTGSKGVTATSSAFNVKPAKPTIAWSTPAAILYGTPLSSTQLKASANVAGTFVYSPVAGTVLKAGTQTLFVTFTPADAADYTTATASVTVTVNKAVLTVIASSPTVTYGSAVPVITPSYSGFHNRDTVSVVTTAPACKTTYTTATKVNATRPATSCSGGVVSSNYTLAYVGGAVTVDPATPAITWATPKAIAYGAALSSAQLDASSKVPGKFVYTPVSGTVLKAGSQTLSVTLTPTDTVDYKATTGTVDLTVTKTVLAVTANSLSKVYGAGLPTLTDTITGFVHGDTEAKAVTGTASLKTTATASSAVGTYPITAAAGTLAATNYSFKFVAGTLTVRPLGTVAAPTFTPAQ